MVTVLLRFNHSAAMTSVHLKSFRQMERLTESRYCRDIEHSLTDTDWLTGKSRTVSSVL
jgi:hypothetical protein